MLTRERIAELRAEAANPLIDLGDPGIQCTECGSTVTREEGAALLDAAEVVAMAQELICAHEFGRLSIENRSGCRLKVGVGSRGRFHRGATIHAAVRAAHAEWKGQDDG